MNLKFESYKLRRELERSGTIFDFYRLAVNAFGEPDGDCEKIGTILGLYHEENDYIRLVASEAAQRRQTAGKLKKQPKLLCLYESIIECNLQVGDYTIINGKQYKVTGVVNIQEWNIIADISLEVVEDGNSIQL